MVIVAIVCMYTDTVIEKYFALWSFTIGIVLTSLFTDKHECAALIELHPYVYLCRLHVLVNYGPGAASPLNFYQTIYFPEC